MVSITSIDKAIEMAGALADPTRLRLLSLIQHNGEICVCDLIEITGLPQSKVSRHLGTLRHAGWVNDRREGQWMHYSMSTPASEYHKTLLTTVKNAHESIPELREDLKKLSQASCCAVPQRVLTQIQIPTRK